MPINILRPVIAPNPQHGFPKPGKQLPVLNVESRQFQGLFSCLPLWAVNLGSTRIHDRLVPRRFWDSVGSPPTVRSNTFADLVTDLNGSSQYWLSLNENEIWAFPEATVTCWLNPDVLASADTAICYSQPNVAAVQCWGINCVSNNTMRGFFKDSGGSPYAATINTAVSLNTWTLMALSWDGSNLFLWKNGVLMDSATAQPSTICQSNTSSTVNIGTINNTSGNRWNGKIAEVRIYDRWLEPDTMAAMYDQATRWELYQRPSRLFVVAAVGDAFFNTSTGALTFTGTATKQTATTEAGALTFAGAVTGLKLFLSSLAGALTFAGAVTKATSTSVAGALTFAGTLTKKAQKILAGALTFAGAVTGKRIKVKAIAGALTFTGTLTKKTSKILAGALTFVGTLAAKSKVTYNINGGAKVHGVQSSWKRIPKRTNWDGTIDYSDWAINTWQIPVMTMTTFETLRAQAGQTLTSLQTNNIDDINFGASYSSAFVEGVVNGGHLAILVMSVKITFRVDVTS